MFAVRAADTDLKNIISEAKKAGRRLEDDTIRWYMFQMLRGCQFLHENWIMHRDIKPENMFVQRRVGKTDRDKIVIGGANISSYSSPPTVSCTHW